MIEIIGLTYISIAVSYLLLFCRKSWLLNPAAFWVAMQLMFFLGTFPLIDPAVSADIVNLVIMLLGLVFFILGTAVVRVITKLKLGVVDSWYQGATIVESEFLVRVLIWLLVAFSVMISVLYYNAIGYNVFIDSFVSYFVEQEGVLSDVTTLRLDAYSTGRYLAPGYVNQFKNVILPLLTAYLVVREFLTRSGGCVMQLLLGSLTVLNVVFLMGTGQRGALFMAFLMVIFFAYVSIPRHMARRVVIVGVVVFAVLFSLGTIFLGRSDINYFSGFQTAVAVVGEIAKRFTFDNQFTNIIGFRYVYTIPIQNGQGWLDGLRQLLPGRLNVPMLPNIVFSLISGSLRGTAPVSVWAEIWYNFGVIGIPVVALVFGVVYQFVYYRMISGPKTLFRILTYAALFVLLGTWAVGSPDSLVNNGIITVIVLKLMVDVATNLSDHRRKRYRMYRGHALVPRNKAGTESGSFRSVR